MTEEKQDAQPDSSSALQAAIASSPEVTEELQQQTPDTETATPQEAESQEQESQQETDKDVPFHEHPRFKELIEEKNWYRQQVDRLTQQQQYQPQIQQPKTDPYAGMTPEEERFWRMVDQRAEQVAQRKMQEISPMLDAGRMELAQLKVQQFRAAHPDVRADSPEEVQIAQRISQGYTPDDAYWSVMGPHKGKVVEEQSKQRTQQRIVAKKQANVEARPSVAPQAQAKPKLSFEEEFARNLQLADEGKL